MLFLFAVEWKMLSFEKAFAARVFLEIKKRMPIALIPPLEDIYDAYKVSCYLLFSLNYLSYYMNLNIIC
jgi:hypothetical protein